MRFDSSLLLKVGDSLQIWIVTIPVGDMSRVGSGAVPSRNQVPSPCGSELPSDWLEALSRSLGPQNRCGNGMSSDVGAEELSRIPVQLNLFWFVPPAGCPLEAPSRNQGRSLPVISLLSGLAALSRSRAPSRFGSGLPWHL